MFGFHDTEHFLINREMLVSQIRLCSMVLVSWIVNVLGSFNY